MFHLKKYNTNVGNNGFYDINAVGGFHLIHDQIAQTWVWDRFNKLYHKYGQQSPNLFFMNCMKYLEQCWRLI